jgi:hypothetical protein
MYIIKKIVFSRFDNFAKSNLQMQCNHVTYWFIDEHTSLCIITANKGTRLNLIRKPKLQYLRIFTKLSLTKKKKKKKKKKELREKMDNLLITPINITIHISSIL